MVRKVFSLMLVAAFVWIVGCSQPTVEAGKNDNATNKTLRTDKSGDGDK